MELVKWNKIKTALVEAKTVDEVKDIRDKAQAMKAYAKQIDESLDFQNDIGEIKIRAEKKIGQMLLETEKNKGASEPGTNRGATQSHDATASLKLKDIGINKSQSSRWQATARIPDEVFENHITETKQSNKELTSASVLKIAKKQKLKEAKESNKAETRTVNLQPRIFLKSCDDFLKEIDRQSVDLLLTDPPYITDVKNINLFATWLPKYLEKVRPSGRGYIFTGAYPDEIKAYLNLEIPEHIKLDQILGWTYRNTLGQSPKRRYKLNWQAVFYYVGVDAPALNCPETSEQWSIQDINAPDGRQGDRFHQWQKPIDIAERFIRHSTNAGGMVVDPFVCTGTFLLAAGKLGRHGIGCDISEENLKIAKDRGCKIV